MEGSRAYSSKPDFAGFVKSARSPDQNAPMKHTKSAFRSREIVMVMCMRNGSDCRVSKYWLPFGVISSVLWCDGKEN